MTVIKMMIRNAAGSSRVPSVPIFVLSVCFAIVVVQNILYGLTLTEQGIIFQGTGVVVDCPEPPKNTPQNHSKKEGRRLVTVFSSGCSNYQDWQSQVLVHSFFKQQIPGEIVRLMSCSDPSYELPPISKHHKDRYRVVRTPDFNALFRTQHGDDYSPRNRPGAMAYWLNGQSQDDRRPPRGHEDVIMAVDPDMIFLGNTRHVVDPSNPNSLWNIVSQGKGVATLFGIGTDWIPENMPTWKHFWCPDDQQDVRMAHCDQDNHPIFPNNTTPETFYNPSYGHPQLMTAEDARTHAALWLDVTNQMRTVHKQWLTEMYSNVITSHRMGMDMQVLELQVSAPQLAVEQSAWESIRWYHYDGPGPHSKTKTPYLLVAHYCQNYRLGDFKFDKRVIGDSVDMRRGCDGPRNGRPPALLIPPVDGPSRNMIERVKRNHTMLHGTPVHEDLPTILSGAYVFEQSWNTELARNGWFIERVYGTVQEALGAYYEEFCLDHE
jgi:hypothetical protein